MKKLKNISGQAFKHPANDAALGEGKKPKNQEDLSDQAVQEVFIANNPILNRILRRSDQLTGPSAIRFR